MSKDWADEKAEQLVNMDRRYAMGAIAKELRDAYLRGGKEAESPLDRINSACAVKPFTYGPYDIHWTGWKASTDSDFLAGQWVAYIRGENDVFCSPHPGPACAYKKGDRFDLSLQKGQRCIRVGSPIEEAMLAMREAKEILLRKLDESENMQKDKR